MPKTSGIYFIINKINNKIYIGQACKNSTIRKRVRNHFYLLKQNKHFNQHFQSAFNKNNINDFKTGVLIFCSDEQLNYYENKYLDLWAGNDEICYNLAKDASAPMRGRFGKLNPFYGKTHTQEVKKKLKEINLGKKQSKETVEKRRKTHLGKKRSKKAKENMKSPFKKMSYEERYGKEKAKEIKEKQKIKQTKRFNNKINHPRYDHKIYHFIHKSGVEEICTQGELKKKYGLSYVISDIVNRKRKSYKGWYLKV